MPQVSFVIPAHNEELHLPRTIDALHEAARALGFDHEVIVADDGSTDRTGEVALEHGASAHRIESRQIAAARNAGARHARGDILFFVDADTVVPVSAVRAALAALEDQRVVGGGSGVVFDGTVPFYARIILLVASIGMRLARWAGGCFLFCRREAFEAAGGFDEEFFASEEIWMSKALKKHGRFVIIRERVISSGRKARQYGMVEMTVIMLKLCVRGFNGAKRREGLEFWYDGQREDALPDP